MSSRGKKFPPGPVLPAINTTNNSRPSSGDSLSSTGPLSGGNSSARLNVGGRKAKGLAATTGGPGSPQHIDPSKMSISMLDGNHKSQINELEDEIQEHQGLIEKQKEYIEGVQRNYDTLAQLCAGNMQEIQRLTTELEEANATLQRLQKSEDEFTVGAEMVGKLKNETSQLHQSISDADEQNKQLLKKCADYQSHVVDLTDLKDDLSRQVEEMQALANARKDECAELQRKLKNEDGQRESLQMRAYQATMEHDLANALRDIENLETELKNSEVSLSKTKNQLKRMEMDRDNFQVDVKRIKEKSGATQQELAEIKAKLDEEKRKVESLEIDNHSLNNEVKMLSHLGPELEEKLRFSDQARRTLQEQYDVIYAEKCEVDMLLKECQDEVLLLKVQLGKITSESAKNKEELSRQLRTSMNGKSDLIKEKSLLNTKVESMAINLQDVQREIDTLQQKNQALRKSRNEHDERIQQLEQLQAEWEEQKNRLMKKQSAATTLIEEIGQLKTHIRQLEAAAVRKDADLSIKASEVTNLDASNLRLRAEISESKAKIQQHIEQILQDVNASHAEKIVRFQSDIANLTRKLVANEARNKELTALVEDLQKPKQKTVKDLDMEKVKMKERELGASIAKIIASEEASEASFTCVQCMDLYSDAVTCIPCGHSYCEKCVSGNKICSQCGPSSKITYYRNDLLEELTTKFRFRKTALSGLKKMLTVT